MHIGALLVLDEAASLRRDGEFRLDEARRRIACRLPRVPILRSRLLVPGPLQGRPLWVDDPEFDVAAHVREEPLPAAADDAALLEVSERLIATLLDSSRPLWALWFITAPATARIGVLLKLHHSIADGGAAVAMLGALFDLSADAPDPVPGRWTPQLAPTPRSLVIDNLAARIEVGRSAIRRLAHPRRAVVGSCAIARAVLRSTHGAAAPRSSINRPVAPGRRVRWVPVELAAAKEVAHRADGTVNDVVLDVAAGGLRALLAGRRERVSGETLLASVPVSLRGGGGTNGGNAVGVIAVRLPVGAKEAQARLVAIVAETRWAKQQHAEQVESFVARIASTPIAQWFITRQRRINVVVTNLAGPPMPVHVLGAEVTDIVPITPPVGNLTISFCAFSYVGRLNLVVTVDASAIPDVDRHRRRHAVRMARAPRRGHDSSSWISASCLAIPRMRSRPSTPRARPDGIGAP